MQDGIENLISKEYGGLGHKHQIAVYSNSSAARIVLSLYSANRSFNALHAYEINFDHIFCTTTSLFFNWHTDEIEKASLAEKLLKAKEKICKELNISEIEAIPEKEDEYLWRNLGYEIKSPRYCRKSLETAIPKDGAQLVTCQLL